MEKRIELEMRGRAAAQITELNLDNCRSTNIVGLTDEFENLGKLSLINVGLTSLKGFPKLPKLKKLELSDNRISSGLGGLSEACPAITNLNMSGNRLKDLEELKPLGKLEHLEVLDLFNNEVTSVDSYRDKVFAMIPSLKYLDGFDPKDGEAPSEGEDDEDANGFNGSEGEEDSDEDGSDVSLSEVLNDELADDSSDWSENEEGEEEDEDEDDSDEEADVSTKKKDDSTVAEGDDKDDEEDDGEEARGKKRKHDE